MALAGPGLAELQQALDHGAPGGVVLKFAERALLRLDDEGSAEEAALIELAGRALFRHDAEAIERQQRHQRREAERAKRKAA